MGKKLINEFFFLSKEIYLQNLTPSNPKVKLTPEYKSLVDVSHKIINQFGVNEFSRLLEEGNYYINLWVAHFIIEFGNPDQKLLNTILATIEAYSQHPLLPIVAEEEKSWLDDYDV